VSLGIHEATDPAIGDALAKAARFVEIPDLNPKNPSTGWQTTDQELRVDMLTPLIEKPREGIVELPAFGTHATALRFLEFLLLETVRAATSRDKTKKDLAQAETLIEALLEDRPDDLMDAWADLIGRGRKWKTEAMKSVRRLPERVQSALNAF
jgi:hypothetical protein